MERSAYGESAMFGLKLTYLAARKALDQVLQEHNLTGSQLELFRRVLEEEGIEQRKLQERLRISSATITGLVDGLVARKLVHRVVTAEDARVKQLFVTPLGRNLGDEVHEKAAGIEERMLTGFSPAEQALLREFFDRMIANLGATPENGC